MAETFGSQHGTQTPPRPDGATEFERSISGAMEHEDTASSRLREKIDEDFSTVKAAAEQATNRATERATEMADRQKSFAADQIERFAMALERAGGELQAEQPGAVGDYTKRLGTSARHFAARMKNKDIGQIANIAEDFGRRQPLAFLGLAAIAGLAASRFLMASAERRPGSRPGAVPGSDGSTRFPEMKETYHV